MNTRRGFSLLELLVVMFVVEILAAAAFPNTHQIDLYMKRRVALQQVQRVRDAQSALAICAASNQPCSGVAALIPAPGAIRSQGYTFTFTQSGAAWTYTAAPADGDAYLYFVDQTGVIRWSNGGIVNATSPIE